MRSPAYSARLTMSEKCARAVLVVNFFGMYKLYGLYKFVTRDRLSHNLLKLHRIGPNRNRRRLDFTQHLIGVPNAVDGSTIERAFAFVTGPASAHASAEPIAALLDRDHMICHQARLSAASGPTCRMVRVLARVASPRLHSVTPSLVWLAVIEAVMAARLQARGLRGDPGRPRLHSSARHWSTLIVK